jgi:hypothetical protein
MKARKQDEAKEICAILLSQLAGQGECLDKMLAGRKDVKGFNASICRHYVYRL